MKWPRAPKDEGERVGQERGRRGWDGSRTEENVLDVIAVAKDLPAVLSDAAAASGVVVDLEGRVGGALQQVAHSISVGGGVREMPWEKHVKQ